MKNDYSRKMLDTIRGKAATLAENKFLTPPIDDKIREMNDIEGAKYLMERAMKEKLTENANLDSDGGFPITKNTPQFSDVYVSQEETLRKTIGEEIDFGENGLIFYPETRDLILNGKIKSMNIAFQFRYTDPSGIGCYLWANGFQMTDENTRTLGKIKDAFINWKQSLLQNGDLIDKLYKVSKRQ